MAKDLVRTRRYVKKFIMMKANIQVKKENLYFEMNFFKKNIRSKNK